MSSGVRELSQHLPSVLVTLLSIDMLFQDRVSFLSDSPVWSGRNG